MSSSYRVVAILLALSGVSRIAYAQITPVVPGSEPMPVATASFGVLAIAAAIGLFRGYRWARWLAIGSSATFVLWSLSYFVWALDHAPSVASVLLNLIEPVVGSLMLFVLLRRRPAELPKAIKVPHS